MSPISASRLTRRASGVLAFVLLMTMLIAALAIAAPTSSESGSAAGAPGPKPSKTARDGCESDGNQGKGNDNRCEDPEPTPSPSETEPPPPPLETDLLAGFGTRRITPVGEPPAEWAQYFTPQPQTKVWGEPFQDLDGNGCFDGPSDNAPDGPYEPHVDQPWNSTGDGHRNGAFAVRGVTIVGDPQSSGKWDGLWANAGFGAKCTLGMHDDTWARAVVLEVGDETVALVSIDVVGFFNIEIQRARDELARRYPDLPIDELVVASTHTHEGVDTMGFWGQTIGVDGKFPAYNAFIRSQVIDAVKDAYDSREEAFVKLSKTEHTMGIRDSREPVVIDPWVYAAQFVRADGSTIGTIVNWSNHPEAQGSNNQLVSSDFPHGTRETLERDLGGTAVYFSGSVGGLMTPLRVDIPGFGEDVSWERTFEIGRQVAVAAESALASAETIGIDELSYKRRHFLMDSDNTALRALNAAGVFDVPTYMGGESWGMDGHTDGVYSHNAVGEHFETEMVAVELGPAMFLTVPGELFPELEIGGFGRPNCEAADTGRPHEPVISAQYEHEYQFVLGLGQDELGYIVPGYDFWLTRLPQNDPDGGGLVPLGAVEAEDPCGESHYEETVSASSTMAPWVTCIAGELAGRNPWATEPACSFENTHTHPYGVDE